ncbi:MAG TPA: hypothetical protein VFQ44_15965 [Streptosporangiaceae bacterium]|nr:hypothetical protein [Streptosporangiaceae bacterium]
MVGLTHASPASPAAATHDRRHLVAADVRAAAWSYLPLFLRGTRTGDTGSRNQEARETPPARRDSPGY